MRETNNFWELPHGFTVFCDDIRMEMGGKTSHMGVYNNVLYPAEAFPTAIRLSLAVNYFEPELHDIKELKLLVTNEYDAGGEETFLEADMVPPEGFESAGVKVTKPDEGQKSGAHHAFKFVGRIEVAALRGPGRLKVRIHRNGDEVRLGTLKIDPPPAAAGAES